MSGFVGKVEIDPGPGARIIPLHNGFLLIPDPIGSPPGWTPFDDNGNLRADLETQGWRRMGAIEDGAS